MKGWKIHYGERLIFIVVMMTVQFMWMATAPSHDKCSNHHIYQPRRATVVLNELIFLYIRLNVKEKLVLYIYIYCRC